MRKRILSVILLICMLVNNLPVAAFAEESTSGCSHACDSSCGYVKAVDCDKNCQPAEESGEIVHGDGCAFDAGSPCTHQHNGDCGVECSHAYAEGICAICGKTEPQPQPCEHTGGTATCTAQAVCTVCETAYGELADHTYSQGICSICGAVCEHTYAEEFCTVCGMAEPVLEPQCNCGVKCNKEFQDDECPVCSAGTYEACVGNEIFAYSMNDVVEEESNSKMLYRIGTYERYGITYPTIDVQGKDGSTSILTTYGENGYLLQHNLPDGVSVSQNAAFVNGGYYVKLFYTVKNNTASTVNNGLLGICADVKIGNNDNALVQVIYRENSSQIIGLSMKDTSKDLQFNLFFNDTPGASGTNRYWIGQYNSAGYIHCWDEVSTITQSQSSWDSAIAVSWDVNLAAGETKIYSVIVGVGEIADPPQWDTTNPVSLTMAAEATQDDLLLHVAAKVKDAEGADDKLYYNVNNGTDFQLGNSVTGDGQTAKEIKGIIDLTNLDNGTYTFRFWIVNDKGAVSGTVQRVITITDGKVTGDHITFIEHSYTVNIRQSNGGAVSSNHTNVLPGAEIALTAIPDTGYRFDKFVVTDSADVEITVTDNKFTMPASDVTVRAIFSPIVYSITVTTSPSNGGTVTGNGEYEENTSVTVTATAASGYHFTGWMEDGEVVSTDASYTFTATGARNLVANFELITHTVTFHANGGSGNMDPLTLDKAVEQALTKNAFTRNGYTFAGWATTANGQAAYTDQQVITVQKDTDLYAVWTLNQYTITYDLAGGSGVENSTYTVESETFTLGTPQKTGYTFIGWISRVEDVPQTDIQITKGSTGNKTYTACWLLTGATVKAGEGYTGIYDGEAHEIRVQATHELVDKTLSYQWYKDGKEDTNKITGATAATWSVTNVTDSGTYYCEVGISDGDIAVADWSDAIVVTITRKAVAEPTVRGTYTYTGAEQTVTLNGFDSTYMTVTGNKGTNARSYEAVVTLNSNYKWANDSDGNIRWSIGNAALTGVSVTQKDALTYTGEAQTPAVTTAATAAGNQPVTFTYRATENESYGTMPQFTAAGTYTVYYKVSAANHNDATGSFLVVVDKASATGTVSAVTGLTYNGAAQALVTAGTVNGGTYQYKLGEQGQWSGNIPTAVNAGNYTVYWKIVGDDNHNSYEPTESVAATIGKKTVTVTADAKTKVYGEEDPVLTYKIEGLATGDEMTGALTRATGEDVDTYAIQQGTLSAGNNYTITYTGAKLTITKATLTVTARGKTITYGDAPANDGVTYSGFVNGDNAAKLGGTLTYTYSYKQYDKAGEYTITPAGYTSGNYEITFENGKLTVGKKTITVAADAVTKVYGETDPALTYKAEGLVNGNQLTGALTRAAGENVGTYAIQQGTLSAGDNYTITYNGADFSITEANAEVTAPTAKTLTYNGADQALVNVGTTQDGILMYSLSENGTYSEVVPTGKNAGDYTVWYYVAGDRNHEDSVKNSITVTIFRAPVTFTVKNSAVEKGQEVKLDITSDTAGIGYEVTYGPDKAKNPPQDVGEYDIYLAITDQNHRHTSTTDGKAIKIGVLSIYEKEAPKTYTLSYVDGDTTVTVDAALAGTVRVIAQPGAAPKDDAGNEMLFAGWVHGSVVYQPGEKFLQPEENVTLTANWVAEKYTISGNVKQTTSDTSNNQAVEGATVTLMLGSSTIATTTTNAQGEYEFPGCLQGTYNLIAEYNGIKQTIKVVLRHGDQSKKQIILPAGKTNTIVTVQPGTPAVVVGGMDEMMTQVDNKVYTSEDKTAVDNGGEVLIEMRVQQNSTPVAGIENAVDSKLNETASVDLYIDLDLTKTVSNANGSIVSESTIDVSNVLLENIIHLPGHLQGKDVYHVFRQHGTAIEELLRLSAANGQEGFVVDKTSITIYAFKYSTYAVATEEYLTVTFNPNGGSVETTSMETNDSNQLTTLPTPVRTGYSFNGWYTAKTGGAEVTTAKVYESDTTLYAQWMPVNYKVTIADTENGTVYADVANATMGTAVKVTVSPKSGYRMATLTVKDEKGNLCTLGAVNDNAYLFSMPAADVIVTATFAKVSTAVEDPTNPKTGDDFQIVFWSGMMMTTMLGVAAMMLNKKKFFEK